MAEGTVARERYDDLLEKWVGAELRVLETRLDGMQKAVALYAHDAEQKNAELNDVRHRFIPREVFDRYIEEQSKKSRGTLVAFVGMGLTIIALGFSLLAVLVIAAITIYGG